MYFFLTGYEFITGKDYITYFSRFSSCTQGSPQSLRILKPLSISRSMSDQMRRSPAGGSFSLCLMVPTSTASSESLSWWRWCLKEVPTSPLVLWCKTGPGLGWRDLRGKPCTFPFWQCLLWTERPRWLKNSLSHVSHEKDVVEVWLRVVFQNSRLDDIEVSFLY